MEFNNASINGEGLRERERNLSYSDFNVGQSVCLACAGKRFICGARDMELKIIHGQLVPAFNLKIIAFELWKYSFIISSNK